MSRNSDSSRSSKRGEFTSSAKKRLNGEWTPGEQEAKSQRTVTKTTEAMKKFESDMSAAMTSIQTRTEARSRSNGGTGNIPPSAITRVGDFKTTLPPSFSPFRGSGVGRGGVIDTTTTSTTAPAPLFQDPRASKSFSEFASANQTVNDLQRRTADTQTHIRERLAAITNAMKTTSVTGMAQPTFIPHPSVAGGASKSTSMGSSGSTTSSMTATPGATLLTSDHAVAGLQAVDKLLQTMNDMMGSTTNIGTTLQSLVTDDRYPTDWSFGLPFHSIMDFDQYREFKDRYYMACWKKASAKTHWISGNDITIGQYVTAKLTTGEALNTKSAPFEIYCSLYDPKTDRMMIGGNRQIPSPSNNGAVMWEPILVAFASPTNNPTLDIPFWNAIQQSFSPIVTQFFGTGMFIKDIKMNPSDGSLYLLMNYLSTVNPAGGGVMAASSSVLHLLSNGTMDPAFDYLAVTKHYGNITVVGVKMALSLKNRSIFLITHKESASQVTMDGPSILRLHSETGQVLSDNSYELDTYLCDLVVTPDEKNVFVTGFEMTDVTKKGVIGMITCFDSVTGGVDKPMQEIKSFGTQGTTYLETTIVQFTTTTTTTTTGKEEYPYSRGLRIVLMDNGTPIVYGNAMKHGMRDENALQIWSLDSKTGAIVTSGRWWDPEFPDASLCVDQLLYDPTHQVITTIGAIRFFSFQSHSTEIWMHQFYLNTGEFTSIHLPCTPDLYAQARAACIVNDRIVFQANMHVSKLKWGRQAMFGSIPSLLPT